MRRRCLCNLTHGFFSSSSFENFIARDVRTKKKQRKTDKNTQKTFYVFYYTGKIFWFLSVFSCFYLFFLRPHVSCDFTQRQAVRQVAGATMTHGYVLLCRILFYNLYLMTLPPLAGSSTYIVPSGMRSHLVSFLPVRSSLHSTPCFVGISSTSNA